jgi:hypothetical protein
MIRSVAPPLRATLCDPPARLRPTSPELSLLVVTGPPDGLRHTVPGVRLTYALVLFAAFLSACGSVDNRGEGAASTSTGGDASRSRVERCVDRLMEWNASGVNAGINAQARRYVRDTYCARFDENGWVYADGALSIEAQKWLDAGATCAASQAGDPGTTAPCTTTEAGAQVLDCALLHIVRRNEVRGYIDRLKTNGSVECDDGTAPDDLGIP